MLGVVQTSEGLPLYHEVFEGNTAEVTTIKGVIEKIVKRFSLSRTSRNQKGNINPRSCARFSDVQPIYVLANVLGLTKRKFVTHWV